MSKRQGSRTGSGGSRPARRPPQQAPRQSQAASAPPRPLPAATPPPSPLTAPVERSRPIASTGLNGPLTVPRAVPTRPLMGVPRLPATTHAAGAIRARETARLFGDYSYVQRDLRRIAILAISALILLVVISFVLPHLLP